MVIGAAVLLLIASFLDIYSFDGAPDDAEIPSLWGQWAGRARCGPGGHHRRGARRRGPRSAAAQEVAGLDLGQFGVAFTVFAAWSALGNIFDPAGAFDGDGGLTNDLGAGIGLILALVATLVMAAAAIATPLVPALKGSLIPAARPAAPQPYGGQPQGGYGYPGAQQPRTAASRGSPAPVSRVRPSAASRSRVSRSRRPRSRSRRRLSRPVTSRRSGSPCRCRVRCSRRTAPPRPSPSWRRAPGTWPSNSAAPTWSPRRRTAAAAYCRTPRASSAADPPARSTSTAPRPPEVPGEGPSAYAGPAAGFKHTSGARRKSCPLEVAADPAPGRPSR